MSDFYLDVSAFDDAIENTKELAKKLQETKEDLDREKNNLIATWIGEGRNKFEAKYGVLTRQLGDIKDDLYQIAEDLLACAEAYIQADTNLAKTQDGVSNRY